MEVGAFPAKKEEMKFIRQKHKKILSGHPRQQRLRVRRVPLRQERLQGPPARRPLEDKGRLKLIRGNGKKTTPGHYCWKTGIT